MLHPAETAGVTSSVRMFYPLDEGRGEINTFFLFLVFSQVPEIITQSVLHGPQTDSNGKQNAYDTNILSFASRCCIHKQIPVNGEGFIPDLQGKKEEEFC